MSDFFPSADLHICNEQITDSRALRKQQEREAKDRAKEEARLRKEETKRQHDEKTLRKLEKERLVQEAIQHQVEIEAELCEILTSTEIKTKEKFDRCHKLLWGDYESRFIGISKIRELDEFGLSDEDATRLCKDFSETNTNSLQTFTRELLQRAKFDSNLTGSVQINVADTTPHTSYGVIQGYVIKGKFLFGQILFYNHVDIKGFFVNDMLDGFGAINDLRTDFLEEDNRERMLGDDSEPVLPTPSNFSYEGGFLGGMFHGEGTITKKFIDVSKMQQKIQDQESYPIQIFVSTESCRNEEGPRIIKTGTFHLGQLQGECAIHDHDLCMRIEGHANDDKLVAGVVTYEEPAVASSENEIVPRQKFVNDVPLRFPIRGKL